MNRTQRQVNAVTRKRQRYHQSEHAALDYTVNWSAVLQGDTITASIWVSQDTGGALSNQTHTSTTASVVFTGDTGEHLIVNKITTAAGITDERIISIRVHDNDEYLLQDMDYCE